MYAEHPQIAARWEAVTPKGKALPAHVKMHGSANTKQHFAPSKQSESNESPKPGLPTLPKHHGGTDFKGLTPNPKARLKTSNAANTKEADIEDYRPKGIELQIGAKKDKLGTPPKHYAGKNQRRDVLAATKKLSVKN